MKLIAHRGASLLFQENSVDGLTYAAQIGAYAVECDVRKTQDSQYVIFHDKDLSKKANISKEVSAVSLREMEHILKAQGYGLVTLLDLINNYKEKTPVLLHIKTNEISAKLMQILKSSDIDFIYGVSQPEMAKALSADYPPNRILAFSPDRENYNSFIKCGAGIIRIWENWLEHTDIGAIKDGVETPEVWIMSRDKNGSMNGSIESLNRFKRLGADGALLNDITLGIEWLKCRGSYKG